MNLLLKQNQQSAVLKAATLDAIAIANTTHGAKNPLTPKLNNSIRHITSAELKLKKQLDKIKNPDIQAVLTLRYIHHLPFEQIAQNTNSSLSNVFKLHKKGLQSLRP